MYTRWQLHRDGVSHRYIPAFYDNRHNASLANELALRIATEHCRGQTFCKCVNLSARVAQAGRPQFRAYQVGIYGKTVVGRDANEGVVCRITGDTARILNYVCKKAILTLKSGKYITVYYTPAIQKPALSRVEPLFSSIPGLVMKYEYTYRKGTVTYTATMVSHSSIDPDVFAIPGSEFPVKKFAGD